VSAPYRHVYVHVPFCARRCSYCDFAIAVRARVPVDEYVGALAEELTVRLGPPPPAALRPHIDTLYFGGGTPSRLGGEGVAHAVGVLARWFSWDAGAEVTIEANPDDVTREAAGAWRAAGVTRASLGSQTFDPAALAWMRRAHAPEQVERAAGALHDAGIRDLSLDLIFALPDAVARDWPGDIARALALAPTHVSLYGLTVERGTPLGRWHARGDVAEADEDRYADEFLTAHALLGSAGFEHYEVSNFARPGHRARHNSAYWSGAPYLGLGPSAHGFDGSVRRWNASAYADWVRRLAAAGPLDGPSSSDRRRPPSRSTSARTIERARAAPARSERPWVQPAGPCATAGGLRLTATGGCGSTRSPPN
jgi:oxygen-independent coproporphyrinogen-3 oxidase